MVILNLAAGKFLPIPLTLKNNSLMIPKYILNVDTSYFCDHKETKDSLASNIECHINKWKTYPDRISQKYNLNMDVFEFMERTSIMFDRVIIYRFLEHVSFTKVEYFMYLVSAVLKKGGVVDVIVPDYKILANMIIMEEKVIEDPTFHFHAHDIKLTTELLNEPSCPHASIWTKKRMIKFWELEKRFIVKFQYSPFKFDGRNLYLRSIIERI